MNTDVTTNPNKALWEKGDFTRIAESMRESGEALVASLGVTEGLKVLDCLYHSEGVQEDFLVLSGRCKVLIDGEERELGPWDFVHVPAGTEHVFVGDGDEPCVVLMTGAREQPEHLLYPKSELAGRYGASAEETTPDPKRAYAHFERSERGRPEYWDQLPWAQVGRKF